MHQIKIRDLNHPGIAQALSTLKTKVLWKTMKDTVYALNVIESVMEQINKGRELYKNLMDQYIELDENKKPIMENGAPKMKNKEEMETKFQELLDVEVPIVGRLSIDKVHDSKLTAEEFSAVKFLFHA